MVHVELSRSVVDGIDDQEAHPYRVAGRDRALRRVDEQLAGEALALEIAVQRQSGQQHSRNLFGRSAANPVRKLSALDEMSGEAEIGDDAAITGVPHERTRGAIALRVGCRALEPPRELGPAAIKRLDRMLAAQRFGDERRLHPRCTKRRGFRASAASLGGAFGGADNDFQSASKKRGGTIVLVFSPITCSAFWLTASSTKAETV